MNYEDIRSPRQRDAFQIATRMNSDCSSRLQRVTKAARCLSNRDHSGMEALDLASVVTKAARCLSNRDRIGLPHGWVRVGVSKAAQGLSICDQHPSGVPTIAKYVEHPRQRNAFQVATCRSVGRTRVRGRYPRQRDAFQVATTRISARPGPAPKTRRVTE